jgi:hypothetical protein
MSLFLNVEEDDTPTRINIDDLFEKNQKRDLKQLSIFNKILNRIHNRITTTARNKRIDKHIWFTIPEYIFGEPVYNKNDCIAYIITKLEANGFFIKYMHPNTIFVSWENWVPSYVRQELKKKTGMIINEKGEIVRKPGQDDDENENQPEDMNSKLFNDKNGSNGANTAKSAQGKQYNPIGSYKPTGNLVYNPEIFEKIEKRMS